MRSCNNFDTFAKYNQAGLCNLSYDYHDRTECMHDIQNDLIVT